MNIYNLIAHILTLTRIILTPAFAVCIYYVKYYPDLSIWLKIILLFVGITDWLDGFVAKKWGSKSTMGPFLIPLLIKYSWILR